MSGSVFEGVRIIDWTIAQAGPKGTVWLAALGAEVLHVEQSGVGDIQRGAGTLQGVPTQVGDGRSSLFEIANFNKKSITLNLSSERGREIMYKLVEKADVFATNQLPDTIEKWSMDYDTLVKYNPQIIYCTNSIVGYKGPYRLTPGYDVLGQGVSGLMTTSGSRGESPTPVTCGIADLVSGFAMFAGIVVALFHKQRTGQGQRVDTSQLQSMMNIPISAILAVYTMLSDEQRQASPYAGICRSNPRDNEINPSANYYKCKDGKWLYTAAIMEKYFANLARAVGRPDLLQDPKFETLPKRMENNKELIKIFDQVFAQHTLDEWRQKFEGQDVTWSPVNDLPDLLEDPQVLANDMLWTFDLPGLGVRKLPGMPFTLSQTPGEIHSPAPEFGANTEETLLDLGYTWEDIAKFYEEGAL